MALKRPPKHRIDGPAVFILEDDDAWDHDRIDAEKAKMKEAGEDPDRHPVAVYFSGNSRFQLEAPATVLGEDRTPADYLDPAKKPTRFKFKRLDLEPYMEVRSMYGREDHRAPIRAVECGLEDIEDGDWIPFKRDRGKLSKETWNALSEDPSIVDQVGLAIFLASMPLQDNEKKS